MLCFIYMKLLTYWWKQVRTLNYNIFNNYVNTNTLFFEVLVPFLFIIIIILLLIFWIAYFRKSKKHKKQESSAESSTDGSPDWQVPVTLFVEIRYVKFVCYEKLLWVQFERLSWFIWCENVYYHLYDDYNCCVTNIISC